MMTVISIIKRCMHPLTHHHILDKEDDIIHLRMFHFTRIYPSDLIMKKLSDLYGHTIPYILLRLSILAIQFDRIYNSHYHIAN